MMFSVSGHPGLHNEILSTEVSKYQDTISSTSDHQSSAPTASIDSQAMTSQ